MSDLDNRSREAELELLRARNNAIRLARSNDRQDEIAAYWAGSGALLAALLLCVVVFQTARDRKRFRELARLDGLTGLVNHTRFFELAQQGFQRARQSRGRFVLIIADIDLFKRINDEHGHLVGDAVLRRVGARFLEAFGKEAVIGRLGGEEIGVALTDCDMDTALARIEHLRAILNRRRADDAEPEITMSFGVAELRREKTLDTLYAHADQALYDAKDAGRNRVVTVSPVDFGNAAFVT
jgi:diguanylate cyclase (GGDEF)-like protein